jgi:hypothetical protein
MLSPERAGDAVGINAGPSELALFFQEFLA